MSAERRPLPVDRLLLAALFVTALVTAQLTAAKLLAFGLPFSVPFAGPVLVLPGAALAYALTFFASDCYAELYGRRAAQELVNVAFAMNFVVLVLVWSTIAAPAADPEFASTFAAVLGASTNIVVGSLLAYVVSQNWDVVVFHRIREFTDGAMLWARNLGSTASSQLLDTVIFVGTAFYVLPALGVGVELGLPLLSTQGPSIVALVVGQYVFKLLVAVLDTPFVYAVVRAARSGEARERRLFVE
jgi:uncharacterized integral membrane protein (TIGR00697 family)